MPSLADELRADQDPRSACKLCAWVASLPAKDQAEWDAELANRSWTHASVRRALAKRNLVVGEGVVQNHRKNGHRKP